MGTLTITEFSTLDGVGQAPGGPEEDLDGGFTHGGWQAAFVDPRVGAAIFERATRMDALLLGRRTYDIFAGYWPTASPDILFTALLNAVPRYVASRTLEAPLAWAGATLLGPDLGAEVRALTDRHERVHVIGSLDLVQSLLALDLVDEIELWVHPVVLGTGKRVFGAGTIPTTLRLTESVTHPTGTLQLTFMRVGAREIEQEVERRGTVRFVQPGQGPVQRPAV